jgi:hypothetical protein
MALFRLERSCEDAIIKNNAIYCQIWNFGSSQPSLNFSNLAFFQAPTSLAPNQLGARVWKLESTVIECAPVRYLSIPHTSLDFSPSRVTSDERITCDTSEFASDAVREITFNFFVCPLKPPTRRNDDLDVGCANGLVKQVHLAKVIGRLGVTRVQNTVKVKK